MFGNTALIPCNMEYGVRCCHVFMCIFCASFGTKLFVIVYIRHQTSCKFKIYKTQKSAKVGIC